MRRLSRILAAVLLLALAISAFGIFSAFAADADAVMEPTDMINWSSSNSALSGTIKIFSPNTGADGSSQPAFTSWKKPIKADNGVNYYTISYSDWAAGAKYTNEPFLRMGPGNSIYYRNDGTHEDAADYMVFDIDISTVTNPFEEICFQLQYYNGANATNAQLGSYYISGTPGKDMYISNSAEVDDAGARVPYYLDEQPSGEWYNYTMVVDVTDTDSFGTAYVYIDGEYVCSHKVMDGDASYVRFLSMFVGSKTVAPDMANESFAFANMTLKAFPTEYNGDMALERENLGKANYTLDTFADLEYCLENLPECNIAMVENTDGTWYAKSIDELDGNLQPGDTVTLYRDITRPILLPGVTSEGTLVPDVTINYNGRTMVAPILLENYADCDWAVIAEDGTATGGKQVYTGNAKDGYTVTTDALYSYLHTAYVSSTNTATLSNLRIVFLKDMPTKFTKNVYVGEGRTVIDLNGHTWHEYYTGNVFYQGDRDKVKSGELVVKNGSLYSKGVFFGAIYRANTGAAYKLMDMEKVSFSKPLQVYYGELDIINCKEITTPGNFAELQNTVNGWYTNVAVINSHITSNGGSLFTLENSVINAKSNTRGGVMQCAIHFGGSTFTSNGAAAAIDVDVYTNNGAKTNAYKGYPNTVNIDLVDSEITVGGTLITTDFMTLPKSGDTTYGASLTHNTTVNIDELVVSGKNAFFLDDSVGLAAAETAGITVGTVTVNTTINAVDSDFNLTDAFIDNVSSKHSIAINLGLDARFVVDGMAGEEQAVTAAYPDGAALAYTSDAKYNFIVTDEYRPFSYKVDNFKSASTTKSGDFLWNSLDDATDPVVMDKVLALPEATAEYKYTAWTLADGVYTSVLTPNFKYSANLTAFTDFYLNLYLPKAVNTSKLDVTFGGVKVTDWADVGNYWKAENAVIKGITPEMAGNTYALTVALTGGLGEKMTISTDVSIEKYLLKTVESTVEEDKNFAQAIINYVAAAINYNDKVELADLEAKATAVTAPEYTNAKWDKTLGESFTAALNLGDSVRWVIKPGNDAVYKIECAGVTGRFTAENGEIILAVKAQDMLGDVVITNESTGVSATINLAGYYEQLAGNEKAQAVVNALYYYATEAAAYNAK